MNLEVNSLVIYVSSFRQRSLPGFEAITVSDVQLLETEAMNGSTDVALGWVETIKENGFARCRFLSYDKRSGWYLRTRSTTEIANTDDLLSYDHSQVPFIESVFKQTIRDDLIE